MHNPRRWVTGCIMGVAVAVSPACVFQSGAPGEAADDVVLECAAGDIHHLLRVRPSAQLVEDLSFSPAKSGVAEVSASEYLLQFHEDRDKYDLVLQVDKATGKGTRRLFDDEQQPIHGHGGTDDIVCTPRTQPR